MSTTGNAQSQVPCTCEDGGYCEVHAGCDEKCGALRNPPQDNASEVWRSLTHFRQHTWMGGCSHAN